MFDLTHFIQTAGLVGLFAMVFAESGLFIGFFLPGDSLLFTAGILAAQGHLAIAGVMLASFFGAVLGDSFGYWFGRKVGPAIFNRKDSFLFHRDHLHRAHGFYEKYGGSTIILARFMPVIRTFAPIVAGVGEMSYFKFLSYNVVGGLIWGAGMPLLGYYSGKHIPNIDHYLMPILAIIIVVSFLPPAISYLKQRGGKKG
jgi:membrane-associated protein